MSFLESYIHFWDLVAASFLGATAAKILEQPHPQQGFSILIFCVMAGILFTAVRIPSIVDWIMKRIQKKKK